MRVSIAGSGYVGLVTGACLAEKGHDVICIDEDPLRVDAINRAMAPIHENGLAELLQRTVGTRLSATTDLDRAVRETTLTLIAVGTPFDGEQIDLSQVRRVSVQIGRVLATKRGYHSVVVKSTVVPGTTEEVVAALVERASGKQAGRDFGVGMNPEFLREGSAIADCRNPDRIIIGSRHARTRSHLERLYAPFEGARCIQTDPRTAELIKYATNSLLATLISFSNELGNLCATEAGVDVADVMNGVCLDRRISPTLQDGTRIVPGITTYLEAGCGFGGSCFPKDVNALRSHARRAGCSTRVLDSVMQTNEDQPERLVALVQRHFRDMASVRVALLGLAFKPGTDDVRESPALPIARRLRSLGARIQAYDPVAAATARTVLGDDAVVYCETLESAVDGAAAIVITTRWDEFRRLPSLIRDRRPQPLVVDGRRMIDPAGVSRYEGIGLGRRSRVHRTGADVLDAAGVLVSAGATHSPREEES